MTPALKLIESSRTKKWPEHRIISACVRIAAIIAGTKAAHDVDPTGNADFAETFDDPLWDDRVTMIGTLASLQAKTAAGIASKARLAIYILGDSVHGQLKENEKDFFVGFARDVQAYINELASNDP